MDWSDDWSALEGKSADPGDPKFSGFIDIKHEDGRVFRGYYKTPMGHDASLMDGPIPTKGRFTHWRYSEECK